MASSDPAWFGRDTPRAGAPGPRAGSRGWALISATPPVSTALQAPAGLPERYLLLALTGLAVVVVVDDGVLTYVSPGVRQLWGHRAAELTGSRFLDLVPVEDQPRLTAVISGLTGAGRDSGIVRHRLRRADGDVAWMETTLHPMIDGGRNLTCAALRDVSAEVTGAASAAARTSDLEHSNAVLTARATDLQDANLALAADSAQLQRSNDELSSVAAILAHDLASPLMGIDYLARSVSDTLPTDTSDPTRASLGLLQSEVARGAAMVRGIRDSAGSGERAPHRPVALEDLVRAVAGTLGPAMPDGELVVGVLPTVVGDPVGLSELFQNLLTNAVKFTRAGVPPRIRISAAPHGDGWDITVADNGSGICAADAPWVFTMGYRGSTDQDGSGIGLAVCTRIAAAHGGTLHVHPNPGHGSVFTVHLPAASGEVPVDSAATSDRAGPVLSGSAQRQPVDRRPV